MQKLTNDMAVALAQEIESALIVNESSNHRNHSPKQGSVVRLCPIPARPEHLLKRGFSPQHLLANRLAHYLGPRFLYDARSLIRVKSTLSQTGSSRKRRLKQQDYSLFYRGQAHAQVIIVDDVLTTGATLKEAQRALNQENARTLASCLMFLTQDGALLDGNG